MLTFLFAHVYEASLVASNAILYVLIIRLFLHKSPKIYRYALWLVVAFRLLCPFTLNHALLPHAVPSLPQVQDVVISQAPTLRPTAPPVATLPSTPTLTDVLPLLWAVGVLCMLGYGLVQLIRLRKNLASSLHLYENIYRADHIATPFVLGLWRPRIYLPTRLPADEVDFILLHEQHHITRGDHITRLLAFVALAVHWWNPLVWVAFVLSGRDMELSCDEAVMRQMPDATRVTYAQSLLRFASQPKAVAIHPLAFGQTSIKARVKNVLTYRKPAFWVSLGSLVLVVLCTVSLLGGQVISARDRALYDLRMEVYATDSNEKLIHAVAEQLVFPDGVTVEGVESDSQQITLHLQADDHAYAQIEQDRTYRANAATLFLLLESAETVRYRFNNGQSTWNFNTSTPTALCGTDYFANGAEIHQFANMLDAINAYTSKVVRTDAAVSPSPVRTDAASAPTQTSQEVEHTAKLNLTSLRTILAAYPFHDALQYAIDADAATTEAIETIVSRNLSIVETEQALDTLLGANAQLLYDFVDLWSLRMSYDYTDANNRDAFLSTLWYPEEYSYASSTYAEDVLTIYLDMRQDATWSRELEFSALDCYLYIENLQCVNYVTALPAESVCKQYDRAWFSYQTGLL